MAGKGCGLIIGNSLDGGFVLLLPKNKNEKNKYVFECYINFPTK